MKRATITLTVTVDFDESEDPIAVLTEAINRDIEGVIGEIIEPHVDAVEDLEDGQ